ncbi:LysR family transcriptional regulator [Paraburkholderia strydomiana]|nr:LysR family transcriptional regulator [Paraburkholderia strydomiana]
MDTLQNMRAFVRVVEAGSFTAAAVYFNIGTGAISRAVSDLEQRLRTRLLNRSTRKLSLTPAGEQYFRHAVQILADIDIAEAEAGNAYKRPSGTLRVHSFASIGHRYTLPVIARYLEQHPDVSLDLTLSQSMPDLVDGNHDISIVTAPSLRNSEFVAHRLGTTHSVLCASSSYIRAHGEPKDPMDLMQHECLILKTPTSSSTEWALISSENNVSVPVKGRVYVNIAESLALAIREGMGIGILPVHTAIELLNMGVLARVLPQYRAAETNIYALYRSRKFVDAKIKSCVDHLRAQLPGEIAQDHAVLGELTAKQTSNVTTDGLTGR